VIDALVESRLVYRKQVRGTFGDEQLQKTLKIGPDSIKSETCTYKTGFITCDPSFFRAPGGFSLDKCPVPVPAAGEAQLRVDLASFLNPGALIVDGGLDTNC
jgi:hypothetical protein